MRLLVIEDYAPIRNAIVQSLKEAGYFVDVSEDGQDGYVRATIEEYDLIVLDLMLPGMNGLEILRRLRDRGVSSHVLILTARDTIDDKVQGLDLGADDYLVKPFAMKELLARVRAMIRREYTSKDPVISIGHMDIHTNDHRVLVGDEEVELTAKEYALLEYLAHRKGQVVTRTEIWQHIYDENASAISNVVDVYVGYLRKKIERPYHPKLIHTRRGEGYMVVDPRP